MRRKNRRRCSVWNTHTDEREGFVSLNKVNEWIEREKVINSSYILLCDKKTKREIEDKFGRRIISAGVSFTMAGEGAVVYLIPQSSEGK